MAEVPVDYTKPYGEGYDNVYDAASAADYEWANFPDNKERERATIIYRDKRSGKIYRTPPIGGSASTVSLQSVFNQLANDQIPLAVLHNHPEPSEGYPKDLNDFLSKADSNIGKGFGYDKDGNPTPITTGRGATGPLKLFLIRPDGTLGEATGNYKERSYYDQSTRRNVTNSFQSTEGALGEVPIDEIMHRIAAHMGRNPNDPRGAYIDGPQLVATRGNRSILPQ